MTRRDFLRLPLAAATAGPLAGQAGQRLRPGRIQGTIRIACVGDSITYGAGIENRPEHSYPAVLQRLLGDGYAVRNFGVSGATLLKRGDKPYWDEPLFGQSTAFRPHAVVIKLGTNDSKPQNWRYHADFARDAHALVRHYRRQSLTPLIHLCTPLPAFQSNFGIRDDVIETEIVPTLRRVASTERVALLNLHRKFAGRAVHFPDGIHPDAEGARLIAIAVAGTLHGHQ
jgi:lysophospholipase L1-like esterase